MAQRTRLPPRHGSRRGQPPVDERLVMPETRYEIIGGRVVYVPPSDIPHGSRHSKVSALLEAYVKRGYDVVADVLTRTSKIDDLAPDVSVIPVGKDPRTGGRRLEELAFEIVSKQRLSVAGKRAASLIGRGVRRVFGIDVGRKRALEWSRATDGWQILPPGGELCDRALALPLPFEALVSAAKADDAVARALLAKRNPVLQAALRRSRAKGEARGEARGRAEGALAGRIEGLARALLATLHARRIRVPVAARRRIEACSDVDLLAEWIRRAATSDDLRRVLR